MLFNSLSYFVFLVIVFIFYWRLSLRLQNIFLLFVSCVFYAFWDVRFLFLITLITVLDFTAAQIIHNGNISRRDRILATCWLLGSCILFVVVPYNKQLLSSILNGTVWSFLFTNILGWKIFITACIGTLIGNLLYPLIVKLPNTQRRKLVLASTIVVKLGILAFFKYFNFFLDSLSGLITFIGFDPTVLRMQIILPVAISFYIFHTMSYTIDIFRGKMEPTNSFVDFALFVAYFPLLAAGPIVRASKLLPVLSSKRTFQGEQFRRGGHLILLGLFKKVAIADGLAVTVNQVFRSTGYLSWSDAVLGPLCFCMQIYCDFSGYSDIARGTSKLLGINIMHNFNLPYFSKNPSEFWRRWHISLSSWLRDYLYIPLGGNRMGKFRTYINLYITMLLGGLWHGAAWNFVVWGLYHGTVLCIYQFIGEIRKGPTKTDSALTGISKGLIFFIITCYGWLLFRSSSMATIVKLTKNLFASFGDFSLNVTLPMPAALLGLPILVIYEICVFKSNNDKFYHRLPPMLQGLMYASFVFVLALGLTNTPVQFIYFNF